MIGQFGTFEYPLAERYLLQEELGRGAMGVVYRAKDVRVGRSVAIKMLHAVLTSEIGIKRFESEIRIVGKLVHPNIVTIHDCGEVDGHLYYVMPDLGAQTLRSLLRGETTLGVREAASLCEQLAMGLQYAHDHHIIHRDIKPENILLADGRAYIVDFGLAQVINDAGSARLTESGLVVGTPSYLSPEQASAEKRISPAADQYALACVLFEMLTGDPPFTGSTPTAIAMRQVNDPPPEVRHRRPEVPIDLAAAIRKALEKTPTRRFASVSAFAQAAAVALRGSSGMTAPRRGQAGNM